MKKILFEVTDQEKNEILNMHRHATNRHYIFEQVVQAPVDTVLGNQGQPVVGAQPAPQSLVNTPQQPAPQQPAPQQPAPQQPAPQQPAHHQSPPPYTSYYFSIPHNTHSSTYYYTYHNYTLPHPFPYF